MSRDPCRPDSIDRDTIRDLRDEVLVCKSNMEADPGDERLRDDYDIAMTDLDRMLEQCGIDTRNVHDISDDSQIGIE